MQFQLPFYFRTNYHHLKFFYKFDLMHFNISPILIFLYTM